MRSHFRMCSRAKLTEAMHRLAALDCLPAMAHGDERLLKVTTHADLERVASWL